MAKEERKYEELGDISIEEANDANIPVNCFLEQIDSDDSEYPHYRGWFKWVADNFMPRRELVTPVSYLIVAREKETLLDLVRKHVVPLYEVASENLRESGKNYFWERKR